MKRNMLNDFSVLKLNRISEKREVWCWGGGFKYGRMIGTYAEEPFVNAIKGLLDSNKKMHGTKRHINENLIEIYPPTMLLEYKDKKILLIISSESYNEIYEQAKALFDGMDVLYTKYPKIYYGINNLCKNFFCHFPLKRQILFYVGSNTSQPKDNSDEIVRYLREEYTGVPYNLVYLTDYPCEVPNGVIQISVSDIEEKTPISRVVKYYYYYCRCKFIFFENGATDKYRDNQMTFYLNHGTIPLKNVKDVLKQPKDLNYAVCPGEGCASFYEEQYSVDKSKLLYMMLPREHQLFIDKSDTIDDLLGASNKQLILWLPTFRKIERGDSSERRDSNVESPVFNIVTKSSIEEINTQLEDNNQILIIKCHPREKDVLIIDNALANIKVISNELLLANGLNTHNLLNRADALISDYSGIAFEYMLLDKPIGYFIPDYSDYARGFSVDNPLEYMPGCKMKTVVELKQFFVDIMAHEDEYKNERNILKERLFSGTDPMRGTEELVDFLDSK